MILEDGETVKVRRHGVVINGIVRTINGSQVIVGRRNDTNYVTHLSIGNAIKYGWELC